MSSQAYKPIPKQTPKLKNSPPHKLTNSQTHKLKNILQNTYYSPPPSSENKAQKVGN